MNTRKTLEDRAEAIEAELHRRRTPSQRQAEQAIREDRRRVAEEVGEVEDDEPTLSMWGDEPEARSASERQAARATRFSRRTS